MRSKFEENIAEFLTANKVDFEYEQWKYSYLKKVSGAFCECCGESEVVIVRYYLPDFILSNGFIIEGKGRFTASDRAKILAMLETSLISRDSFGILFMSDNWTTKAKKKRYSDWAEYHNIDYHVDYNGKVPERWMKN